jgi:hypothetical protein
VQDVILGHIKNEEKNSLGAPFSPDTPRGRGAVGWVLHAPGQKDTCSRKARTVTKQANFVISALNFHLCDLEKEVKSKTQVLCHVSLLDVPMIKTWRQFSH